jgi:hypothetical protein
MSNAIKTLGCTWITGAIFAATLGTAGTAGAALVIPDEESLVVPLNATWELAVGYDYPFAKPLNNTCVTFTKNNYGSLGWSQTKVDLFWSASELSMLSTRSSNAHVGFLFGEIDGSRNYRSALNLSEQSAGLFIESSYDFKGDLALNVKLSAEALAWLKESPEKFRMNCGTHFIHSTYVGSDFTGAVAFNASSLQSATNIATSLEGKTGLFGQGGSVELNSALSTAVSTNQAKLSIAQNAVGVSSLPSEFSTDPSKLMSQVFTYTGTLGQSNLVNGQGVVQKVLLMRYDRTDIVTNWPGTPSLTIAADAKLETLVQNARSLTSGIARLKYAINNPHLFKGLWQARDMKANATAVAQLNTKIATWNTKLTAVTAAIKQCRQDRKTCNAVTIPTITEADFPVQFTVPCPPALEFKIGGAQVGLGTTDTWSRASGTADYINVGNSYEMWLQVMQDADQARYRFGAIVTNTNYSPTAVLQATTSFKKVPVPAGCQLFASTVPIKESIKSTVLPSPGGVSGPGPHFTQGGCWNTVKTGPAAAASCLMMAPTAFKLPLQNKEDLLPAPELSSKAAAVQTARTQKASASLSNRASALLERTRTLRLNVMKKVPATATKPKK